MSKKPKCMVHWPNGELRNIDYRYVRITFCTCYPLFTTTFKEPPSEPATPPPPKD